MFKTCSKFKATDLQNSGNNDNDEMMLTNISDEKMGFIMMECGFEGISFKVYIYKINKILKFIVMVMVVFKLLGCKKI